MVKTLFGPFVSENILTYCRILKLLYFTFHILFPERDTPVKKMSRKSFLKTLFYLLSVTNTLVSRLIQLFVTEELIDDIEKHITKISDIFL